MNEREDCLLDAELVAAIALLDIDPEDDTLDEPEDVRLTRWALEVGRGEMLGSLGLDQHAQPDPIVVDQAAVTLMMSGLKLWLSQVDTATVARGMAFLTGSDRLPVPELVEAGYEPNIELEVNIDGATAEIGFLFTPRRHLLRRPITVTVTDALGTRTDVQVNTADFAALTGVAITDDSPADLGITLSWPAK